MKNSKKNVNKGSKKRSKSPLEQKRLSKSIFDQKLRELLMNQENLQRAANPSTTSLSNMTFEPSLSPSQNFIPVFTDIQQAEMFQSMVGSHQISPKQDIINLVKQAGKPTKIFQKRKSSKRNSSGGSKKSASLIRHQRCLTCFDPKPILRNKSKKLLRNGSMNSSMNRRTPQGTNNRVTPNISSPKNIRSRSCSKNSNQINQDLILHQTLSKKKLFQKNEAFYEKEFKKVQAELLQSRSQLFEANYKLKVLKSKLKKAQNEEPQCDIEAQEKIKNLQGQVQQLHRCIDSFIRQKQPKYSTGTQTDDEEYVIERIQSRDLRNFKRQMKLISQILDHVQSIDIKGDDIERTNKCQIVRYLEQLKNCLQNSCIMYTRQTSNEEEISPQKMSRSLNFDYSNLTGSQCSDNLLQLQVVDVGNRQVIIPAMEQNGRKERYDPNLHANFQFKESVDQQYSQDKFNLNYQESIQKTFQQESPPKQEAFEYKPLQQEPFQREPFQQDPIQQEPPQEEDALYCEALQSEPFHHEDPMSQQSSYTYQQSPSNQYYQQQPLHLNTDIISPPESTQNYSHNQTQNQMQMMCDQISYLHNELNKLKTTSYQVLIDNEHLKQENKKLIEKKSIYMSQPVERMANSFDHEMYKNGQNSKNLNLNTVKEVQEEQCTNLNDEIQQYDELIEVNSTISKQLRLSRINNQFSDIKTNLDQNGNYNPAGTEEEIDQLEQNLYNQLQNSYLPSSHQQNTSMKHESMNSFQNDTRNCANMPNICEETSQKQKFVFIDDSFNLSVNKLKKGTNQSIKETISDDSEKDQSLMKQIQVMQKSSEQEEEGYDEENDELSQEAIQEQLKSPEFNNSQMNQSSPTKLQFDQESELSVEKEVVKTERNFNLQRESSRFQNESYKHQIINLDSGDDTNSIQKSYQSYKFLNPSSFGEQSNYNYRSFNVRQQDAINNRSENLSESHKKFRENLK